MDKDPAERAVIITPGHNVNSLNRSFAEDCLEHILNITPVDVVEGARNADARLSDKGSHVFQCGSAFDAVERKGFQFFLYLTPSTHYLKNLWTPSVQFLIWRGGRLY